MDGHSGPSCTSCFHERFVTFNTTGLLGGLASADECRTGI